MAGRRRRVFPVAILAVMLAAAGCNGSGKSATPSVTATAHSSSAVAVTSAQPRVAVPSAISPSAISVAHPVARTVAVGKSPLTVGFDAATHTLYVGSGTGVAVINAATCNVAVGTGCRVVAHVETGSMPNSLAINHATETVYVLGDSLSVINAKTCNASVTTGCASQHGTVSVGQGPDGVGVDQSTNTIYVANGDDGTTSVIDGTTCDGMVMSGCGSAAATVMGTNDPGPPGIDEKSDTIYVPDTGDGSVMVIDGSRCQGKITTGCATSPSQVQIGHNAQPIAATVDQATDTVYLVSAGGGNIGPLTGLGSVDVINGATCNATTMSGCGDVRPEIPVGSLPVGVALDPLTHKVFVLNSQDDTVSVFDGATCNAVVTTSCTSAPLSIATGGNPGWLDIDPATDTLYIANSQDDDLSVLPADGCSSTHLAGCRTPPASTTVGDYASNLAVNTVTGTAYVANTFDENVSVMDTATCNAHHLAGCRTTWPTAYAIGDGHGPLTIAVNDKTNTIYAGVGTPYDNDDGSVGHFKGHNIVVINGAQCDAAHPGCHQLGTLITVGEGTSAIAVDEITNTIYVANFEDGTVSVIDGTTCDGKLTSGCQAKPATVSVGYQPDGLAVNPKTDTIYVANSGSNTVSVIDGASCHAGVTAGCNQAVKAIPAGMQPAGVVANPITNTIYVANYQDATVSVIDGATCDATVASGCHIKAPTLATGALPKRTLAIDTATNTLFVTSLHNAVVDVFDASTCDAATRTGCSQRPRVISTGGLPVSVGIDPATKTVYVSDNGDNAVSLFAEPKLGGR